MKITAKSIISILPFDEQFKQDLLKQYDAFTADDKFRVDRILWDAYLSYYDLKLEENTQLAFARAERNEEKLDENFYARVKEQTKKETEQTVVTETTHTGLEAARSELQELLDKKPQTD